MKNNENIFVLIIDIFFVLFLCFVLLMFTMILNKDGEMQAAGVYVVDPVMLASVIISVLVYLYFMIKTSEREFSSILSDKIVLMASEHTAKENGTEK